jgi:hypothetical protein
VDNWKKAGRQNDGLPAVNYLGCWDDIFKRQAENMAKPQSVTINPVK